MADSGGQRPILQSSLACDAFGQDETGKIVLVGVFEFVRQPTTLPQFFIVNIWSRGQGAFRQAVRIAAPSGDALAEVEPADFTLPHPSGRHTVVSGLVNQNFPEPGVYWVEVALDDDLEMAWPLPVLAPRGNS